MCRFLHRSTAPRYSRRLPEYFRLALTTRSRETSGYGVLVSCEVREASHWRMSTLDLTPSEEAFAPRPPRLNHMRDSM